MSAQNEIDEQRTPPSRLICFRLQHPDRGASAYRSFRARQADHAPAAVPNIMLGLNVPTLGFGPQTIAADGACSGEKQDQILASLTSVNDSAVAGKDADVTTLTDFLALGPEDMSKITRIGIAVPLDWECQSRDTAGQWPCPNGVPSMCRYYNYGVSDACVFSYCEDENTEPHACCQYFESWLGNVAHYDSDGTNPSVTDAVAHNGETPAAPEAGMTVADYVAAADITAECASNYTHLAGVWGYPNW